MKKIFTLFAALACVMSMNALTYNVTVPAGTNVCYIAGEMNSWGHTEMTRVDDTHYTLEIATATNAMKYKYCAGPSWTYVEKQADGTEMGDRTYSDNDVVAKWAAVYTPLADDVEDKDIIVRAKMPASWTNTITVWVWETGKAGVEETPTKDGEWYVVTKKCKELNIIFKNGTGWSGDANQTVDITLQESACITLSAGSGKATYTVVDCSENPNDTTVTPEPTLGVTYNVTVPAGTKACYIAGEMNGWSHAEMAKVDDTHYTTTIADATTAMMYKYCSGPSWDYVEMQADGVTDVQDRTYTENDVVAAWKSVYNSDGTTEPVEIKYVLMGVAGDWNTGIALEQNPANKKEYMLICQTIAEGDAVKVVTLTNGEKTAYCGNVEEGSAQVDYDSDGNIILAPGSYDFYYKVEGDIIYVAKAACDTTVTPEDPEVGVTYYVTGNAALVGEQNAWSATAIAMTLSDTIYTHTFEGLSAGDTCKLKVTDGTWDKNWGFAAVDVVPGGVTNDADDNIVFVMATDGDVVVTFDGTNISIEGDFTQEEAPEFYTVTYDVFVPAGTYACYIAGEMNGWTFTEMTKVEENHYMVNIDSSNIAMKYKYCSGPGWEYVEMQTDGVTDIADRSYAAYDTVAIWKAVYDPNASVLPDDTLEVYTIAGAVGLVGVDWDPTATINDMVKQEDGTYVLIKENVELVTNLPYEYKVVKNHAWDIWSIPGWNQGNQTLMVDKSGIYDVTFILNIEDSILTAEAQLKEELALIPVVQLAGNMTDWANNAITMQLALDSLTSFTTIPLLADSVYQIKVIVGGNWKGYEGVIDRENCTDILFDSEANCNLYADVAGDYTFTWTFATNTLSVDYPSITENPSDSVTPDPELGVVYNVTVPAGTHACYLAGEMTGWSHTEMTKVDDTHYTLTVDTATTAMKYKYCSGPDWKYVEKTATGEDVVDRTYSANDIVEAWASVYDPNATEDPTPEMGVTYNVTVPAGTYACYIAGEMNGWSHTEMTKVDDTHYTLTVDTATTAMKYKYCSGPGWDYVELQADGSDVQDRTYSENDEVAAWKKVYDPTSTPTPNPGDAKDITVKAKVPAEWTNGITVWVWPTGGAGSEATPTQEGEWYVYTQNCTELNIIFKNGTGWSGDANQTVDMTFTESTCIEITAGSGKATYVVVECDSNTATEDVVVRQVTQKLIYNGQVFLIRDGKMYNVLGQVIK